MAGKIPQDFIDDLIARVDIVDVIDSRVPLRKAGKEYTACCPFHQEKTPSFTVSQQKQFYHCFGCGAHGTALGFLMEYEHMSFPEAVQELANRVGLTVPTTGAESSATPKPKISTDLYDLLESVSKYYRNQLKQHPKRDIAIEYLKKRGLSGETAAEFELGYAPEGWNNLTDAFGNGARMRELLIQGGMLINRDANSVYDRFRERVMFPIRDKRGRVIGFGGRVLGDGSPKYLNSPETEIFHKGKELYGLYQAKKQLRQFDRILVVEGYMDVVSLAQHGVRYAVATLGTAITEQHLNELVRHSDNIVFCFDGDRAGRQAAWRALETALPHVRNGLQLKFMFLPEGEDPDTLIQKIGKADFERRIEESLPLSEFFFDSLTSKTDTRGLDGRAKLVELARPYISKLPAGAYKSMVLERLGATVQMAPAAILESWGEAPQVRLAGGKKPATFSKKQMGGLSPVRRAISLLIQQPGLAALVSDPAQVGDIDVPGAGLLFELLEFLRHRPHVSLAAILEHWRDTPHGRHLAQLASAEIHLPEEGYEAEFLDALQCLQKQGVGAELDRLLQKSRYTTLTQEEKQQLNELLKAGA